MNLFFHIGDKLITAPTSDSILDGVTRKSIIQLAQDLGLDVEIRPLRVSELLDAQKSGDLKEIFGSGTAVVIQPIHGFGYKDQDFDLKPIQNGLAETLKSKLIAIQYNEAPDPHGWRVQV
jgi:branched-chain amino acid aminotransferase